MTFKQNTYPIYLSVKFYMLCVSFIQYADKFLVFSKLNFNGFTEEKYTCQFAPDKGENILC